jgi:MFS family permease
MPQQFKILMLSRFFFTFAVQMQAIVLGWQMYEVTKDPLYLGFIGLAEAIPAIGMALFAGNIVDKGNPLLIYKRIVFISLTSGIVLLLSQQTFFEIESRVEIYLLFISSILTGFARAFSQPAMFSIIPQIIPKELLPKSSAWMSSAMQTARMSGPAAGGILFGVWGSFGTSIVINCFLLITIISLGQIYLKTSPKSALSNQSTYQELLLGIKFVFNHPQLLPAMSLDMISVLFGGVTALLPIYAAEILLVGPAHLGVLRAAPAIGAFVMSALLIRLDIKVNAGKKLFFAVAGFGLCILIFAFSKNYLLSVLALVGSGLFDSVSMVIRTSLVQLSSPDHMRGRIAAVNSIFIGSSNEIGEFESCVAARILGTFPAAVFGGVMCLISVVLISILSPKLRKLDLSQLETEHS